MTGVGVVENRRRFRVGFTLMELMTAITLTAIALVLAGSALAAATRAQTVIGRNQRTLDAESRWRLRLSDMLRHPPRADAVNEPLLQIGRDDRDQPTLIFLSQGVTQPYGVGRTWRVTLTNGADGVVLIAEEIGRGEQRTRLRSELGHVALFNVEVLESASGIGVARTRKGNPKTSSDVGGWRTDWPIERSRPAFVRLYFSDFREGAVATANAGRISDVTNHSELALHAPLIVDLAPISQSVP